MRILLLSQQLAVFRSGVGTYAASLAEGLAARGNQVTVGVPFGQQAEIPGVRVIELPKPPYYDPTPGGWIGLGVHFDKLLAAEGPSYDVVHFTDGREAWAAAAKSGPPLTGMINDSYALDWIQPGYPQGLFADRRLRSLYYRVVRLAEEKTYPFLSGLIANSARVAEAVEKGYGVAPVPVRVIPIGLPSLPPPAPVPLEGEPSILFVGGNFQRKGLGYLLGAAARLRARFPRTTVHVVGKDRNRRALARRARALGLGGSVVFHGHLPHPEVRGMMAGASIFALPSITEGFGLVYLEALRAGTPVVATTAGGFAEHFTHGEDALLVPPGDEEALAAALLRLAEDPRGAASLAAAGRRTAERFTVEAMAEQTEEFFREVKSKRK